MKALVAPSYGPLDNLKIADLPDPVAGPGQVLIRVRAAGINPFDVKLVTGLEREVAPVGPPFVPGVDAAGTVVAVGEGVTRFVPGDEVVALIFPGGALAEHVLVTDGPTIAHRPDILPVRHAAALVTPALTAAALVAASDVQPGQHVLLVGAEGAVASLFLQLIADRGARVLGTATAEGADRVRGLGVKDTIDYSGTDTATEALRLQPGGVDIAIDLVNIGTGINNTASAVRPGGKVYSTLGAPARFEREVTGHYAGAADGIGRLQELIDEAGAGKLAVTIAASYPLDSAVAALAQLAAGRVGGRIVVTC